MLTRVSPVLLKFHRRLQLKTKDAKYSLPLGSVVLKSHPQSQTLLYKLTHKGTGYSYFLGSKRRFLPLPTAKWRGAPKSEVPVEGEDSNWFLSYRTCLQVQPVAAKKRQCQVTVLRSAFWELRDKQSVWPMSPLRSRFFRR